MARWRDDDRLDVEYLAVTDASWAAFDDDAVARPPEPLGPPGARRAVIAAAVVLIGGALVMRTATSHDVQRHPTAAPTAIALPAPDPIAIGRFGGGTPAVTDYCLPAGDACTVSDALPPVFLAAVRATLGVVTPNQQVDVSVVSQTGALLLRYRQLLASASGALTITITISKVAATVSTSGVVQSPKAVTVRVTHPSGTGYVVEVEVKGPLGWNPPMDAITALAADSRLLVNSVP